MRFGAYVILIFSISFALYFMGYAPLGTSMFDKMYGSQQSNLMMGASGSIMTVGGVSPDTSSFEAQPNKGIIDLIIATLAGGALIVAIVGTLAGFGAIYIVPLIILLAILNLFVLPLDFLLTIDEFYRIPIVLFFNMLTMLAVISFIRGGV